MASEIKTQFEPPAYRTPNECTCKLKLLSAQFCTMDWFSSQNSNLLLPEKLTFWAGIIKQLFGQLLAQYLIYLARENRYWAQLTLRPISALPCQISQISDSSQPNNCLMYAVMKNRDQGITHQVLRIE